MYVVRYLFPSTPSKVIMELHCKTKEEAEEIYNERKVITYISHLEIIEK